MRAYELKPIQSLDSVTLVERPDPRPGPGQVLLEMRAWSLNFRDLSVARGAYGGPPPAGRIPLSDGVGIVREVGAGVTRVKPGDRVAGIFMQGWIAGGITAEVAATALGGAIDGMLAEQVVLSRAGRGAAFPTHLSDEEAATLAVRGGDGLERAGARGADQGRRHRRVPGHRRRLALRAAVRQDARGASDSHVEQRREARESRAGSVRTN